MLYNIAFPLLTCSAISGPSATWMTHELKQCIKKKAKLYKLYLKGRITKASYTVYKNRLTNLLRKAKRHYYARLFMEAENDSKRIWLSLNSIMDNETGSWLPCMRPRSDLTKMKNSTQTTRRISTLASRPS